MSGLGGSWNRQRSASGSSLLGSFCREPSGTLDDMQTPARATTAGAARFIALETTVSASMHASSPTGARVSGVLDAPKKRSGDRGRGAPISLPGLPEEETASDSDYMGDTDHDNSNSMMPTCSSQGERFDRCDGGGQWNSYNNNDNMHGTNGNHHGLNARGRGTGRRSHQFSRNSGFGPQQDMHQPQEQHQAGCGMPPSRFLSGMLEQNELTQFGLDVTMSSLTVSTPVKKKLFDEDRSNSRTSGISVPLSHRDHRDRKFYRPPVGAKRGTVQRDCSEEPGRENDALRGTAPMHRVGGESPGRMRRRRL